MVNSTYDLDGYTIYIDAGHGGKDPGAVVDNTNEADINLEISKKLKKKLIESGANVYMTREYDNDLSYPYANLRKKSDLINRAHMIDESKCDMYISIHLNSSNSKWSGAQVFYDDINPENKIIAKIIQEQFKIDLGSKRKIKEIKDLYMYKNTKTKGVLVEVGFISNTNERNNLKTKNYQDKIAESLVKSISKYFNGL